MLRLLPLLPLLVPAIAAAQVAPAPTAYTAVQVNGMMGPPVTMTVQRDGATAVVDVVGTAGSPPVRSFYDLAKGTSYSWNPTAASPECGLATFSGDWGDPFSMSVGLLADLPKLHPKEVGTETVNGLRTKHIEGTDPDGSGKVQLWVDTTYGLIVKWQAPAAKGGTETLIELKSLTIGKPAGKLAMPAACAKLAAQPPTPTEAQRIAAETGDASKYVSAVTANGSRDSCTVLLSVVHAKTLAPLTSGFQLALDTAVDVLHPASYQIGMDQRGQATFAGGALHEVTSQLQNGVLRIENVPPLFDVELALANNGRSSALIHRQCAGPTTKLIFVITNLQQLSDGAEWLWAK